MANRTWRIFCAGQAAEVPSHFKEDDLNLVSPHHRTCTLGSQLTGRNELCVPGFGHETISLYVHGMSVVEIQACLLNMYVADVPSQSTGDTSEAMIEEVVTPHNRPPDSH